MMNDFEMKKAEEYVDSFGVDEAVERLSRLANKSEKAKLMLEYITERYCEPVSSMVKVVSKDDEDRVLGKFHHPRRTVVKRSFDEKERFLNLVSVLGQHRLLSD